MDELENVTVVLNSNKQIWLPNVYKVEQNERVYKFYLLAHNTPIKQDLPYTFNKDQVKYILRRFVID